MAQTRKQVGYIVKGPYKNQPICRVVGTVLNVLQLSTELTWLALQQKTSDQKTTYLVGGFNYFLVFTPKIGEIIHFDEHIFPTGLKPPTSFRVLGVVAYYSFLHSKMFFVVFLDPCVLHSVCFFPKL